VAQDWKFEILLPHWTLQNLTMLDDFTWMYIAIAMNGKLIYRYIDMAIPKPVQVVFAGGFLHK